MTYGLTTSFTCFNRPSVLAEGGRSAAFTYNADGNRVKMAVTDSTGNILTRYYLGGRYECDSTAVGITERLYLGGDAYSAPMVLQKVNSGNWTAYNIGRDYLGSVTHIATASGTLVAEYSYDPWGRLQDPETLEIYYPGDEPELFLGRGFTGHEHLSWFGLINMNARLYDPLLGRFLSPDPYVQAPDFTQNLNRYSYALNNPLKYTDKSGGLLPSFFTPFIFGIGNLIAHADRQDDLSGWGWLYHLSTGLVAGFATNIASYIGFSVILTGATMPGLIGAMNRFAFKGIATMEILNTVSTVASTLGGAINQGCKGVANAGKIIAGNFYLDENKTPADQIWEGVSRHTWEFQQQSVGYFWSSIRNCWAERVDYYGGATFITNENGKGGGLSLGSYINYNYEKEITESFDSFILKNPGYMHEYGHSIDSKRYGPTYLPVVGLFSLISASGNGIETSLEGFPRWLHNSYWTETSANRNASEYFGVHGGVSWLTDTIVRGSKRQTYVDAYPL